jgi:hypothetical protein
MKWKTALSIVVALLGFAALAHADAATPAVAASPAACGANMSTAGGTPMLSAPPSAQRPIFLAATCGSCSRSPCQGAMFGQACYLGLNRGWGTCQSPYGNDCSDGTPQCQCWSGPLP